MVTNHVEVKFDPPTRRLLERLTKAIEGINEQGQKPKPAILLDKESVAKALDLDGSDG